MEIVICLILVITCANSYIIYKLYERVKTLEEESNLYFKEIIPLEDAIINDEAEIRKIYKSIDYIYEEIGEIERWI